MSAGQPGIPVVNAPLSEAQPRRGLSPLLVLAALAALYLLCLPLRDLWYPDEPDLAEITRQMLLSGDWLQLHLYGRVFADYPPLFFWLAAASAKVGGLHEFALRLPSAIAAIGLLLMTWAWTRRRVSAQAASWTVAVCGTFFLFTQHAILVQVDMLLAFFLGASVFLFDLSRTETTPRSRAMLAALSALSMGLAALTKGPAGIVVPGVIIGADCLLHRQWRELWKVCLVCAAGSVVFLAWSAAYAEQASTENLVYFIFKQNVERFLTGWSHKRPFYYYFVQIVHGIAPWTLFLLACLPWAWRAARAGDRPQGLALTWFCVVFAFFSASSSKRAVYILPLYPAAAVMVGSWVAGRIESGAGRRSLRLPLWLTAALLAAAGLAAAACLGRAQRMFPETRGLAWPLLTASGVLMAGGLLVASALFRGRTARAMRMLPLVAGAAYLVSLGWLMPTLDASFSAKDDARWFDTVVRQEKGEKLGFFRPGKGVPKESTVLAFYGNLDVEVLHTGEDIKAFASRQPDGVIVVADGDLPEFRAAGQRDWGGVRTFRIGSEYFTALRGQPQDAH